MNDMTMSTEGVAIADPITKPKSRAEKQEEWRKAHHAEYKRACDDNCTCTPTRAQMLMIDQWDNPPVD
jgi:hypothetical protein